MLLDNGLQFFSKRSQAAYQLLGVRKLATSSYHPICNGGVERVNITIPQKFWLWSSTSEKTIGSCIYLTSNSLKTIPSARRRAWRPTRST